MKHKTLKLSLHKNNIVNLTIMSALIGGAAASNAPPNCNDTGTKDNPNTNRGVPTVNKPATKAPPVLISFSCNIIV